MKEEQNLSKIAKYLSDNMNSEERETLFAWVKESPENKSLLEDGMEVWEAANPSELEFQPDMEAAWSKMDPRLEGARNANKPKATIRRLSFWRPWMSIAAAAVVVFGLGIWFLSNPLTDKIIETKTLAQEKTTIDLPDGTKVWLNQNSSLKYEKQFDKRIVQLEGEAYFDVAKMNGKPFEIFAGASKTRVLGTEFNVRAYPEESQVEIAVTEGKVNFSAKENPTENTNLVAGDFAVLGKAGNEEATVTKETNSKLNAIGWKTETLKFKETTFSEVEEALERYYNVEISVSENIANCTFTRDEAKTPALEEILDAIQFTTSNSIQWNKVSEGYFRLAGTCETK